MIIIEAVGQLRKDLFSNTVNLHKDTDKKVMSYFDEIENRK